MENYKNVFAFDIGIGSTGSAVSDGSRILYMGTHVFDPANEAKDSRLNRSARRTLYRKKWRKKQLICAFSDFNVISKDDIRKNGYLCFTTNNGTIVRPEDKTIYHLRKKALSEKVTKRELLLCLYNILHARGHFLMETIDFVNTSKITFQDFEDKFYSSIDGYIDIPIESKKEFSNKILKSIFSDKLTSKDIKNKCNNAEFLIDEKDKDKLIEYLLLISNYVSHPKKIDESLEKEKCSINDLKADESNLPEFLSNAVELYDLINVSKIMKDYDYLCEVAVSKLDEYEKMNKDKDSEEYKEYEKSLKGKQAGKKHLRSVRNLENGFPNGLYVKEARAILRKQQEYYPEITDNFIEVCESVISARIPYNMGPQGANAKNAWVKKTGKFKYSFDYSMKHGDKPVDQYETIKTWKDRMRSHCTYLSDEFALPKGSLIAETFSILNEMNILKAVSENEDDYYLTYEDKVKIFDQLFLSGKEVKYSEVADLLHLKSFGARNSMNSNGKFNNKLSLYPTIARKIPELKLDSIIEIFEQDKTKTIEDIILSINLYNEEKSKIDFFKNECHYSEDVAKSLSKLKSNGFYAFSEKFILNYPMDKYGNSLMSLLFEDNTSKYTNEQMTLISKATDVNGNAINFSSNKYEKVLENNGGKLGIDLLMSNDKPVIPISRPVIRGLNEAMKVYEALVNTYGVPEKVIIETARDLKDHSITGEQPAKHFDKMKSLYEYLETKVKENKKYKKEVEKWDDIAQYEAKNKTKIELYIRQNGVDLLTGEKIKINHLEDYEIDHILPRGFGDDSMEDKMLISKLANAKKGNRLPLEFIESNEKVGDKVILSSDFVRRVEELFEMKLISEKKKQRLLLESQDLEEFINQNLVDTRYIIREFMAILNAYNKYHNYDTHIVSLRAAYTSLYRKAFNFDKVRDFGDQHHAHDAALLIVADKTLSTYYPNYDRRNHKEYPTKGSSYSQFIKDMVSKDKEKSISLKFFIQGMFEKAYGVPWNSSSSIITQIKNTVPFYSTKVEKNYKGKFFDATIAKQSEYKDTDVLSIVGVNNDKHVFNTVNCAAVDFYKVTDKKGNKKHIAIHIPKVIIDENGVINKEKYIALIKQHYKANELLDENGKLITGYFRFRAYKNDIIYNTVSNCAMTFNIGSIVNKKLEMKYINVFSYNEIYETGNQIRNRLIKEYNLKTKANKEGVDYKEIGKSVFVDFVNRNYWNLDATDKRVQNVYEKVENDKNIYELSNHLAYLGLIINRPGTPPTITGQYKPVADNKIIKANPDAQYIKLKYNILGLKFISNPDGKLIVVSPKEMAGAFKQIKKENFTWQLANDDLK